MVPKTRTCYRTSCCPSVNSAVGGLVGLGPVLGRDLLGELSTPLDFLLDPLVVLGKLLGLRHAAHLELDARTQRAFLRPLLGLFLRRHVEHPEAVEQLLRLRVR